MSRLVVLATLAACASGSVRVPEQLLLSKRDLELASKPLSAAESRVADKTGFAVLTDRPTPSFHVGYTTLFHAHQPVYVTADAMLYAWHASYDDILASLERETLIPELSALLDGLRARVSGDLAFYLDVAVSLLRDHPTGGDVSKVFDLAKAAHGPAPLTLFGATDDFDYSMLQPRGHYTRSPELERYFRAMSWLGRAELRIAKKQDERWTVDRRALRAAFELGAALTGEPLDRWRKIDGALEALVGPRDSLSPTALPRVSELLPDDQIIAAFEGATQQRIRTQLLHAGDKTIAVLLLGQRFVADAQVLSDLTHGTLVTQPPRLMPSPLDVGATVFHNASARTLLEPEVQRYGTPYANALASIAARTLGGTSVHEQWLGALAELSPNVERDSKLPEPLHGDAWGRRMLATQLASWAELRHDHILYAKQSVTAELGCSYPHGYVDPYPAFYEAMAKMAERALTVATSARLVAYFEGMKKTMRRLEEIASREQQDVALTDDDLDFLNHMVSLTGRNAVCTITVDPVGWYADLYYDAHRALWHEPVIADVHTQPTDESGSMVGRVLHVATGNPQMLTVTLQHDGGAHPTTYRGYVSTYFEKVTTGFARTTDEQWQKELASDRPAPVGWMRDLSP